MPALKVALIILMQRGYRLILIKSEMIGVTKELSSFMGDYRR